MYNSRVGAVGGVLAGNGALATTGFDHLLWAEAGVILVVVGLVFARWGRQRRLRQAENR